MAKIMAVNAGSSSLKFQLLDMPSANALCEGVIERIGLQDSIFTMKANGEKIKSTEQFPTHLEAVNFLLEALTKHNVVGSLSEIDACGHRVVHGGDVFQDSAVMTAEVIAKIKELSPLAPLHNPANLTGYEAFKNALPNAGHVAVFDTAFHQSMPQESYAYAIPKEWASKYKVRKYGFHGTSHKYIAERAAAILNNDNARVINCHLGNGASICAIKGNKSMDTSMGFTPLAGLMMGTRSGDIDPAIITYMMEQTGQSATEIMDTLNKKSGMLGVSGISSDARDIEDGVNAGNPDAIFTEALYIKKIADYIGSYIITLGGVDAITFTAGLGENAVPMRKAIIEKISAATGAKIDEAKNNVRGKETVISADDSAVKVILIPTNEELMIARDTVRLLGL